METRAATRPDSKQIARQFLDALASNDPAQYESVLSEQAGLRLARWDGSENYRPRARVIERLRGEWSAWDDPTLTVFTVLADGDACAAAEFRIQATENGRYMEHNRSVFLALNEGQVQMIDLYCPEPVPSARRKGWIAPATLTEAEVKQLLQMNDFTFDVRERMPPNTTWRLTPTISYGGAGGAHPAGREVARSNWTAEEADARIEELIAYHRDRNWGFHWEVSSFDMPPDMPERLERHGFVWAGYTSKMARVGLDHLEDIPVNPDAEVEILDGSRDEDIEAVIRINSICFRTPPEQVEVWRPAWYEQIKDPKIRAEEPNFLVRLGGQPVAVGRLFLKAGTGQLTGAGTLPEYRGKKLYSTVLRRRLEEACRRGYNVATIDAGPMSRRVVERYGFREYGWVKIYGWMPVIDLDTIRSLVPDE